SSSAVVPAGFLDDGPGDYTIRGRIIDKDGGFTDYTTSIHVTNTAPTATLSNGGTVSEHTAGSVSFSNQLDPSNADTTAGFHYAYDFNNDGNFTDAGEIGVPTRRASNPSSSAVVPASFLDDGPGDYTIRGQIIDKDGGFTDYTTTIH